MKPYIKPELFYERYEVSQHLADCAWEFHLATDPNTCKATADAAKLPGLPAIFLDSGIGCEFIDAKEYENYCYHTSADGIILLTS